MRYLMNRKLGLTILIAEVLLAIWCIWEIACVQKGVKTSANLTPFIAIFVILVLSVVLSLIESAALNRDNSSMKAKRHPYYDKHLKDEELHRNRKRLEK